MAQLAAHDGLIPLTIPEVRRLVYRLVVRILAPPEAVLHWSRWRRLHQARAMRSHYRRRRAHHAPLQNDDGHIWRGIPSSRRQRERARNPSAK